MKDKIAAGLISSTRSLRAVKPNAYTDPQKAWEGAKKFESMYVSHFIQQMFQGNKNGLFGGGQVEVLYRSVLAENIANSVPFNLGIAEKIYPTLLKNQGGK